MSNYMSLTDHEYTRVCITKRHGLIACTEFESRIGKIYTNTISTVASAILAFYSKYLTNCGISLDVLRITAILKQY